jgi:hypothetical protein
MAGYEYHSDADVEIVLEECDEDDKRQVIS